MDASTTTPTITALLAYLLFREAGERLACLKYWEEVRIESRTRGTRMRHKKVIVMEAMLMQANLVVILDSDALALIVEDQQSRDFGNLYT